eukprot:TRINITY_DN3431_c0_g1_i1.p2 TRINITY_DN3431_c0_g1~~TRINITY_DN3431_c0_g1_i1.p2  ORF type:complete len:155 (+),score=60.94 TRINITY_DN3431_c0_g1_i1:252-716(+)
MDKELYKMESEMATQIVKGDDEFLAAGGADDADNSLYLIESENKKNKMIRKHEASVKQKVDGFSKEQQNQTTSSLVTKEEIRRQTQERRERLAKAADAGPSSSKRRIPVVSRVGKAAKVAKVCEEKDKGEEGAKEKGAAEGLGGLLGDYGSDSD